MINKPFTRPLTRQFTNHTRIPTAKTNHQNQTPNQ
jgi:hypothetical protein